MQEYTTIYDRAEDSFIERKSEFIGHIAPVETEEQALAFIAEIKKKHHDATHNTHAYILRNGVKRYSDDGEPQGTAGVPMLDCIEKEGLVDVAVVVTRYFGGILLGASFPLLSCLKANDKCCKVFVHLSQKVVVSRGNAFGRTPQSAKYLVRKSAFLRARELFAREKVLES